MFRPSVPTQLVEQLPECADGVLAMLGVAPDPLGRACELIHLQLEAILARSEAREHTRPVPNDELASSLREVLLLGTVCRTTVLRAGNLAAVSEKLVDNGSLAPEAALREAARCIAALQRARRTS